MFKNGGWIIFLGALFLITIGFYFGYDIGESFAFIEIKERQQKDYYNSLEEENKRLKKKAYCS